MEKNELLEIVSRNLQKLRLERGYTQEEMSELAGISTSFYANLERGKKGMSIFVFRDLADALEVSTDSLLYSDHTNVCIQNIESLLCGMPDTFIAAMERLIRLCKEEFTNQAN